MLATNPPAFTRDFAAGDPLKPLIVARASPSTSSAWPSASPASTASRSPSSPNVGIQPTIVTYKTMLDSCCKEGKAEEALKLLGEVEMMDTGCLPNDVTYNVVIEGLSKTRGIGQGREVA